MPLVASHLLLSRCESLYAILLSDPLLSGSILLCSIWPLKQSHTLCHQLSVLVSSTYMGSFKPSPQSSSGIISRPAGDSERSSSRISGCMAEGLRGNRYSAERGDGSTNCG